MAATATFEAAECAAREACAAARAAETLAASSAMDPAEAAQSVDEAVRACDSAIRAGGQASGTGEDGDVAGALQRLIEAEAKAGAAQRAVRDVSHTMSDDASLFARKAIQAEARALAIRFTQSAPAGGPEGALAEARRSLRAARAELERASDFSSLCQRWQPEAGAEAEAARAHRASLAARGRARRSVVDSSPALREAVAALGVRVVEREEPAPVFASLGRHRLSVFERTARLNRERERAQQAVDAAEARVAELEEQARVASSYRARRAQDLAAAEAEAAEARASMQAAADASGVPAGDIVAAREAAAKAAAVHREAARALLQARRVVKAGGAKPGGGLGARIAALEGMRRRAEAMRAGLRPTS